MFACAGETTETAVGSEAVADTDVAVDEGNETDTWDNNEFNTTFASNNAYENCDLNADNMLDENEYGAYNTYFGI